MSESSVAGRRLSTVATEQTCKFGTIVLALWRDNPSAELARRIKSTKRHAGYLIEGKRKVNARCVQAIVNEILD